MGDLMGKIRDITLFIKLQRVNAKCCQLARQFIHSSLNGLATPMSKCWMTNESSAWQAAPEKLIKSAKEVVSTKVYKVWCFLLRLDINSSWWGWWGTFSSKRCSWPLQWPVSRRAALSELWRRAVHITQGEHVTFPKENVVEELWICNWTLQVSSEMKESGEKESYTCQLGGCRHVPFCISTTLQLMTLRGICCQGSKVISLPIPAA